MKTLKIFEIDLIRDKIVNKLSNADASNLMTALRPTKCWERFFHDKCSKTKNIYCPICILNHKIDPIEDYRPFLTTIDRTILRNEINNLEYPHEYILRSEVFEVEHPNNLYESEIVFIESPNFKKHQSGWGLSPRSPDDRKKAYFEQLNFETIPQFTTENDLIDHVKEVGKLCFIIIR